MLDKITLFTGAGASSGCGKVFPYNPPLGRNLYEDLEDKAATFMDKINEVIGRNNINDFEAKMDEIWKSKKINGFALNSILAEYFSRFSPSTDNRFIDLARIFQENPSLDFVYSTLNYDCIAELAASSIGLAVNYDIDKVNTNSFNTLKIHGSCNFINDAAQGKGTISAGLLAGTVDGGAVRMVQPNQVVDYLRVRPLGPVMAFYMKNKPTQTNRSYLEKIQEAWQKRITESEKVVIIGANPNSEDMHVWESISNTKAKIGFVGRDSSLKNLKKIGTKKTILSLGESFESSMSEIENFIL